jgi:ion channel
LALSGAILWAIFERVRSVSETTGATIAEAFIGYLVMGTAFAQLYWILNQLTEKPFNQVIPGYEISTFLYFSLVTLTGVGYGGIAPVTPYVRMVAAFEGVVGIFDVAVVVARLVSSYRRAERSRE